jgi:hypothetical protein
MKIQKNTKSQKKVKLYVFGLIAVILFATGLVAYLYFNNTVNNSGTTLPSDSDRQQAENLENNPDIKSATPNTDSPQPVQTVKNGKSTVQMSASANTTGNTLYVRGGIDNAVVNEGTCYAELTGPNGQSIRKDTTLLQNPSTTDCKTISVDLSELSSGAWTAALHFTATTLEGTSNEAPFTVQ